MQVEVFRQTIAGQVLVGSYCRFSNQGGMVRDWRLLSCGASVCNDDVGVLVLLLAGASYDIHRGAGRAVIPIASTIGGWNG